MSNNIKIMDVQYLNGLFAGLKVLYEYDHHVEAKGLVEDYTSIKEIQTYANRHGSEVEQDIIKWIKDGHK